MSIEITRTIDAPPSAVFRALTDAGELARWWTTGGHSDARSGGAFSYDFQFEDASRNHTYEGVYHDVTPDERVSYPWYTSLGETTGDVRLRPADSGTELTLVHTGWGEGAEAEEAIAMHEPGWSFFLGNLKSYLEGGADLRVGGAMGQKTTATV